MQFAPQGLARTARWLMLALLISLIPATSHAGVFISVGFAPPPLVTYVQPPCPEAGWMWEPGYWAYGPDGYYWVPGTWVAAPEPGMYWTPGYWGFANAAYIWHPGYWGPQVGYYGGVNYGFGFFGVGFVGGMWHGGVFAYNTAVVHVGPAIRNVYINRTVIASHTVVNNHVAFSGGPGGVNHPPTAQERAAMNQRHIAPTAAQTAHARAAMNNHNAYFNANHGHPANVAAARPAAPGRPSSMERPQQQMRQQQQTEQRQPQQMQRQQQHQQQQEQRQQKQVQRQQPREQHQQPRSQEKPKDDNRR